MKGHMEKSCSPELLQEIRQLVMKLTLTQLMQMQVFANWPLACFLTTLFCHMSPSLSPQGPGSVETFCKQLETALENALQKYLNQMWVNPYH